MSLILNGDTGVSMVQSGVVEDGDLVNAPYKLVLGTAQTASGTSVDFTGIPSWAKRITVMFSGVSANGTSNLLIQLGTSSGVEITSYVSTSDFDAVAAATATSGLVIQGGAASNTYTGHNTITKFNGNSYISSMSLVASGTSIAGAGSKTLSATLDRIRITTVNGTDTFDAGTINIMYEG